MPTQTLFTTWNGSLAKLLPEIHALIRAGDEAGAAALYRQASTGAKPDYLLEDIHREAVFLKLIDASKAFGTEGSKRGVTPRQALIGAALVGWFGDDPSTLFSPVGRSILLAWADSHYGGPKDRLEVALDALVAQGLYFEVHPGVFAEITYYCRYDSGFLAELPDGAKSVEMWNGLKAHYDEYSEGWTYAGVCGGQGLGMDPERTGVCLGTACRCFSQDGEEACEMQNKYNPQLVQLYAARRGQHGDIPRH